MRTFMLIPVLALAAVPAVALGQPPAGGGAAGDCKAQLAAMGPATFKATYAPHGNGRSAMARCRARFRLIENQSVQNAAKACRTEQSQMSADAFAAKYGTNRNGRNAFGKCVSSKAKNGATEEVHATIGAAKACKAERKDPDFAGAHNGKTFAEFYGKGRKNAFGKCVAAKAAHAEQQNP